MNIYKKRPIRVKQIKSSGINVGVYINDEGHVFFEPCVINVRGEKHYISIPSLNENTEGLGQRSVCVRSIGRKGTNIFPVIREMMHSFCIRPFGGMSHFMFENGDSCDFSIKNMVYVSKNTYQDFRRGYLKYLKDVETDVFGLPKKWDDLTEEEFRYFTEKREWMTLRSNFLNNVKSINEKRSVKSEDITDEQVEAELKNLGDVDPAFISDLFFEENRKVPQIAKIFSIAEKTVIAVIEMQKHKYNGEFNRDSEGDNERALSDV